jgi:hypothetical protein
MRSRSEEVLQEGQFYVHDTLVESGRTSLCCRMTNRSKIRYMLIWLVQWSWFDRIVMFLILFSTATLAAKDHSGDYENYNAAMAEIDKILGVIFATECLLKVIAHGFVLGPNTYLRNSWNFLDFCIVVSSMAGNEFKLFRLTRVLRPLRTIKRVPILRLHAEALI